MLQCLLWTSYKSKYVRVSAGNQTRVNNTIAQIKPRYFLYVGKRSRFGQGLGQTLGI
jgi:hypothetical protein